MQAAADWNSEFNRDRKRERKDGYWDLQTMVPIIQGVYFYAADFFFQ